MIGKIFKAYDVRAIYPDPLNAEAAWKVGYAAGTFLKQQNGGRSGEVLVGRDMRPHSPELAEALMAGLLASGVDVVDVGMCDTSFQYYAINELDAIGGIQTTASHNPENYNGFKISGRRARPVGAPTGLLQVQKIAESLDSTDKPAVGRRREADLWAGYRKHVLSFLSPLKRPIRLFVDASNGMAGMMVPRVFDGVENLEIVELNFEITGSFVHEPNPLVARNMVPTQEGVREHRADLGACFDGDADRCMIVDETGRIIGCDHLTAMLAGHFVAIDRTNPRTKRPAIVYDLRSSKVLEETVRSLDAEPVRGRVGHVFMKQALHEHEAVFGGELSGHFYFRDNYYADSGAIALCAVLSVLSESGKSLAELTEPLRKYPQSGEINFVAEDKQAVMEELKRRYSGQAQVDELDGVTIDAFEGLGWWFNVRPSNTEPLLRLNAEAKDQSTLEAILTELTPLLGEPASGH